MTDKVQIIRQEIERLDEEYRTLRAEGTTQQAKEADLVVHVLQKILNSIDSLPEESASEDLEEAAQEYAENHFQDFIEVEDDPGYWCSRFGFIAGAEWQKQQIMKDAVELTITNTSFIPLPKLDIKAGDKVKIILS